MTGDREDVTTAALTLTETGNYYFVLLNKYSGKLQLFLDRLNESTSLFEMHLAHGKCRVPLRGLISPRSNVAFRVEYLVVTTGVHLDLV